MKSVYQIYTEPANLLDLNSANKTGFGFNKLKAQLKDLSQTACGFKKDQKYDDKEVLHRI